MPWPGRPALLLAAVLAAGAAEPARADCEHAVPGQLYVSRAGDDQADGSCEHPFRHVAQGVQALDTGGTLNLRGGVYLERVVVRPREAGTPDRITIRSYPGERASIDASLRLFRDLGLPRWAPATEPGAHRDEFVSRVLARPVDRGSFLGPGRYTRLITYKRRADLRATNERRAVPANPAVPTYMGPGVWFDEDEGRAHIRLSRTHSGAHGFAGYRGPEDPRTVPLALARTEDTTVQVLGASDVRFERLDVRGGGEDTVKLTNTDRITFDHVRVFASTVGVRTARARSTTFTHTRFLDGLPEWLFRSDIKSGDGPADETSKALLIGTAADAHTTIDHSEIRDGHDFSVSGTGVDVHHNLFDGLDDEALLLDRVVTRDVRVHENVIVRSLSAISLGAAKRGGPYRIYRNLIDLRAPTAGNRPRTDHVPSDPRRFGHLLKANGEDGPWDLFQNTILSSSQEKPAATFAHLRSAKGSSPRSAYNNVFVALRRAGAAPEPILVVPSQPPLPASDGNAYLRIGGGGPPAYVQHPDGPGFPDLPALRAATPYEQHGIEGPPGFRHFDADALPQPDDDLRLADGDALHSSPAAHAGVPLPDALAALDPYDIPAAPSIGAYRTDDRRLRTGVDGGRVFPALSAP